jgi:lysophospholipase L1-like esterase
MALLAMALLASCTTSGADRDPVSPEAAGPPPVYVAIGASETAGVGTTDPFRDAWPKVLWRDALPDAVLYDFGVPGSTVAQALVEQLPEAVAAGPDVATVWLNVNDLVDLVPVERYESRLDRVVGRLRAAGADVYVANVPVLTSLPLYLACRPDPPPGTVFCPLDRRLPPPEVVERATRDYNAAIARVADHHGATVVDLHALGDVATSDPGFVSDDGFHPSTEGAGAIAERFAEAIGAAV